MVNYSTASGVAAPRPIGDAPVLLLSQADVAAHLDIGACIAAVERAFMALAKGQADGPASLALPLGDGMVHVKAAALRGTAACFAAKINANFPGNPAEHGLPTIQGLIILGDAANGRPLAVMDSMAVTALRTAAATAVAARHLARPDSRVATICGCGAQSRDQLRALLHIVPIERVYAVDLDATRAQRFAKEMADETGLRIEAASELAAAARSSDICITCTPARHALLQRTDIRPGTFIAAVGADNPDKQEIAPALMAAAKVVVDSLDQCAAYGDLHHAIAAGAMTRANVHGELVDLVAQRKPGRTTPDEITLFDSTGSAIQDVAAAALVVERALAAGAGARFDFAAGAS